MNNSRNKILSVLAMILLISMCASLSGALAHNPAISTPTWTYAAVAPNPIGVGQSTTFVYWNTVAPPDAASSAAIRWNWTISVTTPNASVLNLGTFMSDVNGLGTTTFVPDAVGNYMLTVTFPDTNYSYSSTATQQLYTNDLFQTSSYSTNFTVQSEPVVITNNPLPSEYWSTGTQGDWFKIVDNNYGGSSGQSYGNHHCEIDYSTGSLTAHILWVRPLQSGGQVGGKDVGVVLGNGWFQGMAYHMRFLQSTPTIILDGKLYYKDAVGNDPSTLGYIVLDMRSGDVMMRSSVTALNAGYSSNGVTCLFGSTNFGTPRDPDTMLPLSWTLSGVPSATSTSAGSAEQVGPNGEVYRFILANVNTTAGVASATPGTWNVEQWNSSKVIVPGMSGTVAAGTASAYDFNVTITYNGAVFVPPVRTVYAYEYNNYVLLCNVTGSSGGGTANAFGRNDTWTFYTVSLKPGSVGQVTSNCSVYRQTPPLDQTLPVPNQLTSDDLVNYAGAYDTVGHVLPLWGIRSLVWYGINTDTGAIWGPTAPQVAMDYYAAPDNTQFNRDSFAMNGYLFEVSWGGILYMYNATTGTLLYQYGLAGLTLNANVTTAGQYTLYNGYPSAILGATTENNMVYTFVNEHSPNVPELKNSYMRCFDIANMNEVWIESQYGGVWTTGQGQEILGNGYNTELNSHNMEIMCEGVGPSATTVMATNSTVVGNKMMIEGTVMDVSPGTVQNDLAGRFPNGVPAVQDGNNMTAWMEYLYMHHEPRPDVLGVPVTLTVVDASGTTTDIGTATTDSTGYFSFLYTPSTAGTYTIIAAFQGSTAYAPSYSQSTYTVAPPSATASPTPTPSPAGVSTDTYVLGSTAAIIVVIAIVTAVIALMLRKKP